MCVCVQELILNTSAISNVNFTGFFACQYLGSSLDMFILKIVSYCLVDHIISLLNNIALFAKKHICIQEGKLSQHIITDHMFI